MLAIAPMGNQNENDEEQSRKAPKFNILFYITFLKEAFNILQVVRRLMLRPRNSFYLKNHLMLIILKI